VVHPRESDVLVRQVAQFVYSGVDIDAALGDGSEQVTQAMLFDELPPVRDLILAGG
jgi:hypothetical protein